MLFEVWKLHDCLLVRACYAAATVMLHSSLALVELYPAHWPLQI
jgi:hypothetical protein